MMTVALLRPAQAINSLTRELSDPFARLIDQSDPQQIRMQEIESKGQAGHFNTCDKLVRDYPLQHRVLRIDDDGEDLRSREDDFGQRAFRARRTCCIDS